jgi:two-component system NarL family response regulator
MVLVDVGLPDRSGIALGKDILEAIPEAKVVALTAIEDPALVREAVRAGFHGYVNKDATAEQFQRSLRSVLEGQLVVPQRAARGGIEAEPGGLTALTRREREVLSLLAEGLNSEQMAERLHVSTHTIRTHVQNVLDKLNLHSRLEAAAYAVRHGIAGPPGS